MLIDLEEQLLIAGGETGRQFFRYQFIELKKHLVHLVIVSLDVTEAVKIILSLRLQS